MRGPGSHAIAVASAQRNFLGARVTVRKFNRRMSMRLRFKKNALPTAACSQASRGAARKIRPPLLGTPPPFDPCGKTALAAALCWWLALHFGLHDGYWGSISAIIVLQSDRWFHRQRLARPPPGHADRRTARIFVFTVWGASWNYILAVLVAIIVCGLLGLRNSSRLACVTITIIMLVHKEGPRWGLAMDRVGEVILGIVVALAVTTLVFPDRARLRLRDGLAQEFLLLGSFFEAILEGFRGAPAEEPTRVA